MSPLDMVPSCLYSTFAYHPFASLLDDKDNDDMLPSNHTLRTSIISNNRHSGMGLGLWG